ncbi:DUF3630 family protein [Aeromonas cavernicola]|uniref:DUF3630 domain-containing protein n=1 Tax=Aeromonas cavernicola TaxID=1006623 RepID=A0A2H9U7A5_9GAMM|nr:DUF3630 family protein [Aeromonas cavernicola]PJG59894.1 DUF3630 domain-containing protein [Aeromonas cavernicola]
MNWRIIETDPTTGVILLTCPALAWDNFPALAPQLLAAWELELLEQESGADRHSWRVAFEGSQLRLEYDHYSGCWLDAVLPEDREVLYWLARQHKD